MDSERLILGNFGSFASNETGNFLKSYVFYHDGKIVFPENISIERNDKEGGIELIIASQFNFDKASQKYFLMKRRRSVIS